MIKFGPSGNDEAFYAAGNKHTEQAAKFCKSLGLDCYEYSFGRGILLSEGKAELIGQAFKESGVEISVHAPYFINFANPDDEAAQKSYNYVLNSAKFLKLMGGKRVVFHPAAQGKATRDEAVKLTKKRLEVLRDYIYLNNLEDLYFCPETMGKLAQIGTLEEIVDFCKIDKVFLPAIDFGHINAREQGSLNTVNDYKNLTFADTQYGPEFEPLAVALKQLKLEPYIVSESAGTQSADAAEMKRIYGSVDI